MEDNVYELDTYRARMRPESLPPRVRAEMELADRLYDALAAQGFALCFEAPEDGDAPVRAELRSTDGHAVRRVSLFEAVGADDPEPPAAA